MTLAELLDIRPGVTAVIGGGGKTTLLRTLGGRLAAEGRRVILTTTTKIFPFPSLPTLTGEVLEDVARALDRAGLVCVGAPFGDTGKLAEPVCGVELLAALAEFVLVEADGSAGRPMKAHAPHEPATPPGANQTVCVVGASGFGRPIYDAAHRPERYAALAGAAEGDPVTPERAAAVLTAEGLHDRVYVNQVETAADWAAARRLAGLVTCPVVAGSLWKGEYHRC